MSLAAEYGIASCPLEYADNPDFSLADGELHLWLLTLDQNPNHTEEYLSWLSPREQEKYKRLPEQDKAAYLKGRAVLRELLARYCDTAPEQIRLSFGRLGKPALAEEDSSLAFNYSDTNGRVIYALSRSGPVGVDIEKLDRVLDYSRILKRKFSVAETQAVCAGDGPDAEAKRFLAAWTRKESYGKAIGVGVNYRMNQVELACDLNQASGDFTADSTGWTYHQYAFDDYVACLTTPSPARQRIRVYPFEAAAWSVAPVSQ